MSSWHEKVVNLQCVHTVLVRLYPSDKSLVDCSNLGINFKHYIQLEVKIKSRIFGTLVLQEQHLMVSMALHFSTHCTQKATSHQVTTMLSTFKNVSFPGHNNLLTTGTDDPTL